MSEVIQSPAEYQYRWKKLWISDTQQNIDTKKTSSDLERLILSYHAKSESQQVVLDHFLLDLVHFFEKSQSFYEYSSEYLPEDLWYNFYQEIVSGLSGIQISEYSLTRWILTLKGRKIPETNTRTYTFNLVDILKSKDGDVILDGERFQQALKTPIQTSLDTLKDEVETESYFGGAMTVSYERVEWAKDAVGAATVAGLAGAWMLAGTAGVIDLWHKGLREAQYCIKKVVYRDQGVTRNLDPSIVAQFSNAVWSKLKLAELNMQIMQKAGLVFNVVRQSFTTLQLAALDKASSAIARMKYVPAYGTPADFELARADVRAKMWALEPHKIGEFLAKIQSGLVSSTKAGAKALSKGWSVAFMWVDKVLWNQFFLEYQKNYQDSLSIYKGAAEMWGFYAGAKIGSLAPGLWKIPGSLVGGVAGIMGVSTALHTDYVSKELWKTAPNRYAWDGKKSWAAHAVTMGTTNDMVDRFGWNFGIPGTRWGARIANPFGKDVILPELMFNKTDISFATNPREYLNGRVATTDLWNQRMDEFTWTETTPGYAAPAVMEILAQYKKWIWIFRPANLAEYDDIPVNDRAKTVLRDRLMKIIAGGNIADEANVKTVNIVDDVLSYITDTIAPMKNPKEQEAQLRLFLRNYGNILKITPENIAHDKELLKKDESYIRNLTDTFVGMYSGEYRSFLKKVFDRIYSGKKIVTNYRDQVLFDALLDSRQALFPNQAQAMSLPPKEIKWKTQWDYLCFLLGNVAKYHTEAQYLDNIEKTWYANQWETVF